jgi:hypothetical protein
MKSENQTMITKLGVQLPGENEIAKLAELEADWKRIEKRERELNPLRIPADYEAAYEVFVDNPTAENREQHLELIDQARTATQFAASRVALAERRRFVAGKAGYLLKPFCAQIMTALYGYLAVQMKDLGVPRNDPSLLEYREVLDVMTRMEVHLRWATEWKSELSPMELAAPILCL